MTEELVHLSQWQPITVDIDLRWSTVLEEWRQNMPSLKVFRMGSGDWDGHFSTDVAMAQTASQSRVVHGAYNLAKQRNEDTVHLNYNKPCIGVRHEYTLDMVRDGVGLSQNRECLLQYVHFEVALGESPWVERDFKDSLINEFEDGYKRYWEARRQDEEALSTLYASTRGP